MPCDLVRPRASSSTDGNDSATVKVRSGGCFPVLTACATISMAMPVLAGTTTVAASSPLLTQAWPV